jgi:hypothetical protein
MADFRRAARWASACEPAFSVRNFDGSILGHALLPRNDSKGVPPLPLRAPVTRREGVHTARAAARTRGRTDDWPQTTAQRPRSERSDRASAGAVSRRGQSGCVYSGREHSRGTTPRFPSAGSRWRFLLPGVDAPTADQLTAFGCAPSRRYDLAQTLLAVCMCSERRARAHARTHRQNACVQRGMMHLVKVACMLHVVGCMLHDERLSMTAGSLPKSWRPYATTSQACNVSPRQMSAAVLSWPKWE